MHRLLQATLAVLIVLSAGCVVHPVPMHGHAHHRDGGYIHAQHHRHAHQQVFGDTQHMLINPHGDLFLMGDSQFRQWQAPLPPAE